MKIRFFNKILNFHPILTNFVIIPKFNDVLRSVILLRVPDRMNLYMNKKNVEVEMTQFFFQSDQKFDNLSNNLLEDELICILGEIYENASFSYTFNWKNIRFLSKPGTEIDLGAFVVLTASLFEEKCGQTDFDILPDLFEWQFQDEEGVYNLSRAIRFVLNTFVV